MNTECLNAEANMLSLMENVTSALAAITNGRPMSSLKTMSVNLKTI